MSDEDNRKLFSHISHVMRENPSWSSIFNWRDISQRKIPSGFIKEFAPYLVWGKLCETYPVTLDMFRRYRDRIDVRKLQSNPNIDPEIILIASSEMDWDTVQSKQQLNPKLLEHFYDQLDNFLIFKYQQNLSEEFIKRRLNQVVEDQRWSILCDLIEVLLDSQKLSIDFIKWLVDLSDKNSNKFPSDKAGGLLNIKVLCETQTLPESYIIEHGLVNLNISAVSQYQKLTNQFIVDHIDELDELQILKHQTLNAETIIKYYERYIVNGPQNNRDQELHILQVAGAILGHQKFDAGFFSQVLDQIRKTCTHIDVESWFINVYSAIFLRSFIPEGDPNHLGFSSHSLDMHVIPYINWDKLAIAKLSAREIDYIIDNVATVGKIKLYLLLKYNPLQEYQIEKLDDGGYLSAVDWWMILTWPRTENILTPKFVEQHKSKLKWWQHVQEPEEFLDSCKKVFKESNNNTILKIFLNDFVSKGDWDNILRYDTLPSWFIDVFSHYAHQIDKFWWKMCYYQTLDDEIIRNNIGKIDLPILVKYQKRLNYNLIDQFREWFDEDARAALSKRTDRPNWFII